MATVNQTYQYISQHNDLTPSIRGYILDTLDSYLSEKVIAEDYMTDVVFSWRCIPIPIHSAEKVLVGVHTLPDGFNISIKVDHRLILH